MTTIKLLQIVVGISSFFGFTALLAYLYYGIQVLNAQRSIQGLIEGEAMFNASQIVKLLSQFKDDKARLAALTELTHFSGVKAQRLFEEVKSNVDINKLTAISINNYQRSSRNMAIFFLLLASLVFSYYKLGSVNHQISENVESIQSPDAPIKRNVPQVENPIDNSQHNRVDPVSVVIASNSVQPPPSQAQENQSPIKEPQTPEADLTKFPALLLEIVGLPKTSLLGWASSYSDFDKFIPVEKRIVSKLSVISANTGAMLSGIPAKTSIFFVDKTVSKIIVRVATEESSGEICSMDFFRKLEIKASSIFTKESDMVDISDPIERNIKSDSYECEKFECAGTKYSGTRTEKFSLPGLLITLIHHTSRTEIEIRRYGKRLAPELYTECYAFFQFEPQKKGVL